MPIVESREIKINGRVFKIEDIRRLANFFIKEQPPHVSDKYTRCDITFAAKSSDGASFSGADASFFADDSPVLRRRPDRISMNWWFYSESVKCNFSLILRGETGLYNSSSAEFEISGPDSRWVNGTLKEFEELIDSTTPQSSFVSKHKIFSILTLALGIGWVIQKPLDAIFSILLKPPTDPPQWAITFAVFVHQHPFLLFLFDRFCNVLVGLWAAAAVIQWLEKLWPSIELQIGPAHTQIVRQRRERLIVVFTTCLLPILLAATYDVIKWITAGGDLFK